MFIVIATSINIIKLLSFGSLYLWEKSTSSSLKKLSTLDIVAEITLKSGFH